MLFGRDEMLLASLALGAEGWIGSTFNFSGAIYQNLIKAFHSGNLKEARQCQREANEVIRTVAKLSWLPSAKAAFGIYGVDLGTVRPPLKPLSELEVSQLHQQLKSFPIGLESVVA
ncbi:MAG TPA: dihydrodipicolinate synthase family protein [Chthoniobacterales bacterium]